MRKILAARFDAQRFLRIRGEEENSFALKDGVEIAPLFQMPVLDWTVHCIDLLILLLLYF